MTVKINKHGCSQLSKKKKQLRQQNKNVLDIIVLVVLVSKLNKRQSPEILCHCMKSVQIRSFSGPNTVKYGPERTPYMGTFHIVHEIPHCLIRDKAFKNVNTVHLTACCYHVTYAYILTYFNSFTQTCFVSNEKV